MRYWKAKKSKISPKLDFILNRSFVYIFIQDFMHFFEFDGILSYFWATTMKSRIVIIKLKKLITTLPLSGLSDLLSGLLLGLHFAPGPLHINWFQFVWFLRIWWNCTMLKIFFQNCSWNHRSKKKLIK